MERFSKLDSNIFINLLKEENVENKELCLITGEPLDKNYINLHCDHKFNYESFLCKN